MLTSLSSGRLPSSNGITKTSAATLNGNGNNGVKSRLYVSRAKTETDEMQRRKCENLISYYTAQIHHLSRELEIEKCSRDTHLAKIAKALLCFEAKLKNDQKNIRQQLYEKDAQLNRLASEVILLREQFGVKNGEVTQIDTVAQYCPNCRKQYYLLNTSDVAVQVNKHGSICRNDIDKGDENNIHIIQNVLDNDYINLPFYTFLFTENLIRPTSSSEDGLEQVFSSEVRRSRRYMSKRTSGTFREYLNSRNIESAFSCGDESFNKSSESLQPKSEQMEHKPIIENNRKDGLIRKGSMRRSTKSAVAIKCDKNGNKLSDKIDSEMVFETKSSGNEPNAEPESVNNQLSKMVSIQNNSFFKEYEDDVNKPKNPQFESNDDWYASAIFIFNQ